MSQIEALRNDAARIVATLFVDSSLSNALALSKVANQMIEALSCAVAPKSNRDEDIASFIEAINKPLPSTLRNFSHEVRNSWFDGEPRTFTEGVHFSCSLSRFRYLLFKWSQRNHCKLHISTHSKSITFFAIEPKDTRAVNCPSFMQEVTQ